VENFSETDSFFNNAGIEQNITEDFDNDEFAKVVNINLNGVFYGLKYVLRVMKEQGYGSIVNTAVEYGEFGNQKNFGSRGFRDSSIYIEYKV
jgi:NAD(P)-dependent dehydrogenase (short-subunit alcohol dehydrogenase family)